MGQSAHFILFSHFVHEHSLRTSSSTTQKDTTGATLRPVHSYLEHFDIS